MTSWQQACRKTLFPTKDGWAVMRNHEPVFVLCNVLGYRNTSLLRRGHFVVSINLVEDIPAVERSYTNLQECTPTKKRSDKECRFLQVLVQGQILQK